MHFTIPDADPPAEPAAADPRCPLCNGPLVPLRGSYRCARCAFILCAGCEACPAGGGGKDD